MSQIDPPPPWPLERADGPAIYAIAVVHPLYTLPKTKAEVTPEHKLRRWIGRLLLRWKLLRRLHLGFAPHLDTRTLGYFNSLERAREAMANDESGMQMCRFSYAVIEEVQPGIHSGAFSCQWWFKWDHEQDCWIEISTPEKPAVPEFAQGMVAWSMG